MATQRKMTETEWGALIFNTLKENPEWLETTNNAIMQGVKARLSDEVDARANAEVALSIAYDHANGIPDYQIPIVKNAIKKSKMFGGTEYAETL